MNKTALFAWENLIFALGLSLLMYLLQSFQTDLIYQRNSIMTGEVWRLWSGNLVHTNNNHLYLNLAGLWLLLLICGTTLPLKILIFSMISGATLIGLGLFQFNPHILWYAGFSGILYGLFVTGGIYLALAGDFLMFTALAAMIALKFTSAWPGESDEFTKNLINAHIIEEAHLYGVIAGLLTALPGIYRFTARKLST